MATDKTGAQASVTDNPAEQRYEIAVSDAGGGTPATAGFTAYRDREANGVAERVFFHTEVGEEFGGRGLGTILITEALDDTRAHGRTIVGVCPMVAAFLKKHPDYADATHPVTPEVLTWLQSALD
ncbi:GNAT family N-acetyltransferase [Gordonia sp. OPL2]|uniref:GNAT family N-acetyltransferase n=1 Tax=Gordonia sp. OPL2 TaxID=2486274 RepID=UPI001654EE26|nr:GNAT family N-acetyltransferase [Gordonia sp. OPL2]ROZ89418.1 N-acetyltransferase [Gordonia sp. OPL2]